MPLGEDTRKTLAESVARQKAAREATQQVAADIADSRRTSAEETQQTEVKQ